MLFLSIRKEILPNHHVDEQLYDLLMTHISTSLIHAGYYIYPINYIAFDKIENTQQFTQYYTQEEVIDFENYIENQLSKVQEVPNLNEEDMAYMRNKMLEMYANPLKNKIAVEKQ